MDSILSYPERGPYGKSNYRGNCSGYIIKDLIETFQPELFVDVCEGSGTSRDVCRELAIPYVGLDLHSGFDFTRNSVLERLENPAAMVFSHPPYHDMINYSLEHQKLNKQGTGKDISQCSSVEEFLELANVMLLNQREATQPGGIYTTLIGDMRKDGKFHSFQSDFIQMLPKDELISVSIKAQFNELSSQKSYKKSINPFVAIKHEYLLIWKKKSTSLVMLSWDKAKEQQKMISRTWRVFVQMALIQLGGRATLNEIYKMVETIASEKVALNENYKAKIRQTLQFHFESISRGTWSVSPQHS